MSARPVSEFDGKTVLNGTTEHLRAELAAGWTTINGVDVRAELDWREAQGTAAVDAVMELEATVRGDMVSAMFGTTMDIRHAAGERVVDGKRRLYAAIDALNPDQLAQYAAARRAAY